MRTILSITLISLVSVMFNCKTEDVELLPAVASHCVCPVPGFISISFQNGITLKQAQSYASQNSKGIDWVNLGITTAISADSADYVNMHIRSYGAWENGIYISAYDDYSTSGKVVINFSAYNLLVSNAKLNAVMFKMFELLRNPIVKSEKLSVGMVLWVETGDEKTWINLHKNDTQVFQSEQLLLRCTCSSFR